MDYFPISEFIIVAQCDCLIYRPKGQSIGQNSFLRYLFIGHGMEMILRTIGMNLANTGADIITFADAIIIMALMAHITIAFETGTI